MRYSNTQNQQKTSSRVMICFHEVKGASGSECQTHEAQRNDVQDNDNELFFMYL